MARPKSTRRPGHTRLSAKNQVTIPQRVVDELGASTGDEFRVEADDEGRVLLTPVLPSSEERRQALGRVAGSLPGVWPQGEAEAVRDEWL